MRITKGQLKILHTLLNNHRMMDYKRELIHSYTAGRTTSSREMTREEARGMIDQLSADDPFQRMRKKVFSLARGMGMIWGETREDRRMNAAKIDLFLEARGAVKKPLGKLNYDELHQVVTQFSAMSENTAQRNFNKAVDALLDETGIGT